MDKMRFHWKGGHPNAGEAQGRSDGQRGSIGNERSIVQATQMVGFMDKR